MMKSLRYLFARAFEARDKVQISGRGTVFVMSLLQAEIQYLSKTISKDTVIKVHFEKNTYFVKVRGLERRRGTTVPAVEDVGVLVSFL